MHSSLPFHLSLSSHSFCSFHKPAHFFAYSPQQPLTQSQLQPPSPGVEFSPSTPSLMSPGFLLGAVIAHQWESPEHRENEHPFLLQAQYGLQFCSLFGFKLPSKWLLVLTSCQGTSSLATWLFTPVFKEKCGYSESLKNPPSLSIFQSQQDCYQTKKCRNLPLLFKTANLCFVNNCSHLPNLRKMFFISIHVRVVILNGKSFT